MCPACGASPSRLAQACADFVTPTLRRLAQNPRLALGWLRLNGDHWKYAPA